MDVDRFEGLIAVQHAVTAAGGNLQAVMQAIVDAKGAMPQATGTVVELRDGDQLYYAAASGTSAGLVGLRLALNASLSGMSILTGAPLSCVDSEQDVRVNQAACRKVGLRSMIVVPIPHRGQTVGVLKYYSDRPAAFSDEDMLVAHLLVGPIAIGFSSVAEADAERARKELAAIIQLKEELVANVSHELRTPLTAIAGSLGLLDSGAAGKLPEKAHGLVAIATKNAQRLTRLVNDLLDIDKFDSGRAAFTLAETDLRALILEAVTQNEPFATRFGAVLLPSLPTDPVIIQTDGDRLLQALTNLISNAAKFSHGTVHIDLRGQEGEARIVVRDDGPGIPEAFRMRLFERFAQGEKTSQPGTGLGLAITKSIVELLGGSIALDPHVAQGAAFEIRLPLMTSERKGLAA
ncbi:GAF domain-containing sensor histidine kinase [Allosphingosinicella flava]|uniref:histidine kinase n=2 Tax=Allosphingosinicella flava TaxID=2771430 RepID=A0A7T2GKT4_9SPHN|nr:GAF domain-containing sensor histidine kinase [Sphingosinicella flava]